MGAVGAVVGETGGADAGVTAREDYGDAAAAELGVEVADGAGVGDGNGLLWEGWLVGVVLGDERGPTCSSSP